MNSDNLICVDALDRQIDVANKEHCHREGILHRAFSIFLFYDNKILLHKRAENKYHSGGLWTNSCCSHPRNGEKIAEAVSRRLAEELGVRCQCVEVGEFLYRHKFSEDLFEYEYDHVFIGEYTGEVHPNPKEISEYKWVDKNELIKIMNDTPEMFTVWFFTAVQIALKYINSSPEMRT